MMAVSSRSFEIRTTLVFAAACVLTFACSEQLDIVVSHNGLDQAFIAVRGSLDLRSGTTFVAHSPAVSDIPPFVKTGHSDDGSADFSLIDMQVSDTSYYLLDAATSSWSFECIQEPTDMFKYTAGESIANSIGFSAAKQEGAFVPYIVVSKDGDYIDFLERTSVPASSLESLGLKGGSACMMEFGKNRILLKVGDVSDATLKELPTLPPSPSPTDAPTDAPTARSCDWLCQAANFFGF